MVMKEGSAAGNDHLQGLGGHKGSGLYCCLEIQVGNGWGCQGEERKRAITESRYQHGIIGGNLRKNKSIRLPLLSGS